MVHCSLENLQSLSTEYFSLVGLALAQLLPWEYQLLPSDEMHSCSLPISRQSSWMDCQQHGTWFYDARLLTLERNSGILFHTTSQGMGSSPTSCSSPHYVCNFLLPTQADTEFGCLSKRAGREWNVYFPLISVTPKLFFSTGLFFYSGLKIEKEVVSCFFLTTGQSV